MSLHGCRSSHFQNMRGPFVACPRSKRRSSRKDFLKSRQSSTDCTSLVITHHGLKPAPAVCAYKYRQQPLWKAILNESKHGHQCGQAYLRAGMNQPSNTGGCIKHNKNILSQSTGRPSSRKSSTKSNGWDALPDIIHNCQFYELAYTQLTFVHCPTLYMHAQNYIVSFGPHSHTHTHKKLMSP